MWTWHLVIYNNLKQGQLSFLMKNQNNPMELRDIVPGTEHGRLGYISDVRKPSEEIKVRDVCVTQNEENTKVAL